MIDAVRRLARWVVRYGADEMAEANKTAARQVADALAKLDAALMQHGAAIELEARGRKRKHDAD